MKNTTNYSGKINEEQVEEILEKTIRALGGNIDPRACSNRYRKTLIKFYRQMNILSNKDFWSDMHFEQTLDKIIGARK